MSILITRSIILDNREIGGRGACLSRRDKNVLMQATKSEPKDSGRLVISEVDFGSSRKELVSVKSSRRKKKCSGRKTSWLNRK